MISFYGLRSSDKLKERDMTKEKDIRISFRAPATLRDLVRDYISLDAHVNESDFYRDAAREKIQRDAPELYRKLFCPEKEVTQNE